MSLDKLLGVLKNAEVDITDELKSKISNTWNEALAEAKPDDDLLTQEEVNSIVQKRLARERSTYESELKELRGKMENLVDPDQIDEVKGQFKGQIESLEKQRNETTKEYEIRLAAAKAGARDEDYILFQAEKKGIKEQLGFDDQGNVVLVDEDGNPQKDEEGNIKTAATLMESMKEEMPIHFGEVEQDEKPTPKSPGATNPTGGDDLSEEDKKQRTRELLKDMGYKSEKEE